MDRRNLLEMAKMVTDRMAQSYEEHGGSFPLMALCFADNNINTVYDKRDDLPPEVRGDDFLEDVDELAFSQQLDAVLVAYADKSGALVVLYVSMFSGNEFSMRHEKGGKTVEFPFPPHALQQYRTLRDFSVASKDIPAGSC